jgi:hypothetical protein
MYGHLVDGRARHPDSLRLTGDIDDFFDEVGEDNDYVAVRRDEQVELQNSSGVGARIWSQDSLSLAAADLSTLRIERRWAAGRGIGRVLLGGLQSHYDIGHHRSPQDPDNDLYTTWEINPARGLKVVTVSGRYDASNRRAAQYPVGGLSFKMQADKIREVLRQARNPLHRKTGIPKDELDEG